MQIICPECAATYEVPFVSLRPNRKVRCIGCGTQWVPEQPADSPPPPAEDVAELQPTLSFSAFEHLAATSQPEPSIALRAAWVASVVVLLAVAAAAATWRSEIVSVWPASAWVLGSA